MDDGACPGPGVLRRLVEEYMVNLELGKHDQVSKLGFKICVKLIEIYEDELETVVHEDDADDYKGDGKDPDPTMVKIISDLCSRLRERSDLAIAFANVVEFVSVRDMACFSKMFAIPFPDEPIKSDPSVIDFDRTARVLRQSIHLLKSINRPDGSTHQVGDWLFKSNLQRVADIGFPKHLIDFDKTGLRQSKTGSYIDIGANLLRLSETTDRSYSGISETLGSSWFRQFAERSLIESYPLDRFTILVGVWQVAVECGHRPLEQLISQLVDQLAHEESNSMNEEELLNLSQVGSFWVTYHKHWVSFVGK